MGKRPPFLLCFCLALLALFTPATARAFCGFFVSGADGPLVNDATQVALMRQGTRTVLSMSNSYQGPLSDFALVIPVPVILQKENVKTLSPTLFDQLSQLTAPRLVEYWEEDPCGREEFVEEKGSDNKEGGTGTRAKGEEGSMGRPRPLVRVEAEFSVDEYDIVILSADDSTALDAWLRQNGYKIPQGIEPFLHPYVVGGSKFFVAKVNAAKVHFQMGRALLSPLRFHYDSEKFELPIRLGLANASGPQDLLIYLLAPKGQRYEIANYENAILPTNLEVKDEVRDVFPSFYAALFDRTVAGKPRAVVTEYSWAAGSCDPCPGPTLDQDALSKLGADALPDKSNAFNDVTLTRLHARYSKDTLGEDLVFRPAAPIEGGRGTSPSGNHGATPSSSNNFQGRYIIRHPWTGPVTCSDPDFGVWGGPPDGTPPPTPPKPGTTVRRDLPLDKLILDRPDSSEQRLWLVTQLYYKLRRLLLQTPAFPIFSFVVSSIWVALVCQRNKNKVAPIFGFFALFFFPGLVVLSAHGLGFNVLRAIERSFRYLTFPQFFLGGYGLASAAVCVWLAKHSPERRPASWWAFLAALIPLLLGVLSMHGGFTMAAGAVNSLGVGWVMRGRILAEGESEGLQGIVVGASASALLLAVLLRGLLGGPSGAPPPGLRGRVVGAGLVGVAVGILEGWWLWRGFLSEGTSGWPVLVLFLLGFWSVWMASRQCDRWPDEAGKKEAEQRLLTAALALGLGVSLVQMATAIRAHSLALDPLVSGSPERMLSWFSRREQAALWLLLSTPVMVLIHLLPLGILRRALHQDSATEKGDFATAWRSALAALIATGLLGGFVYRAYSEQHQLPKVEGDERLRSSSFLLPSTTSFTDEVTRTARKPKGAAFQVDAQGQLKASPSSRQPLRAFSEELFAELGKASEDFDAPPEPILAVDERLSYASLLGAIDPLQKRRQTSFRWMVGIELHREQDRFSKTLGRYEDTVGWMRLRSVLPVELIESIEVSKEAGRNQRSVLAVKAHAKRLTTRPLRGGLGVYWSRSNNPDSYPRATIRDQFALSGDQVEFSNNLAEQAAQADELLVVVPSTMTAGELSELLLELRWYAEIKGVRKFRSRFGAPKPPPAPSKKIVLTTSKAVFED